MTEATWIKDPLAILTDGAERGVVVADGKIVELVGRGALPKTQGVQVFEAGAHVVLPGLINTHHHFYQTLTRALPAALDRELFPWLKALYPVWAKLTPEALDAAATLSHRYITDRFLPDKAIDLVDEACARLRTEIDSMPADLDELTRRVTRLEIEEAALEKEEDKPSRLRLEELRRELADLQAEANAKRAQWEAERQAIRKVQELRSELEQVRREAEDAERRYDLNRAAELRYGRLAELERQLAAEEERLQAKQGRQRLLREVVTDEEPAHAVHCVQCARPRNSATRHAASVRWRLRRRNRASAARPA